MAVTHPSWLFVALVGTLVYQVPPRDQAAPQPAGTARISGVVVAADNGVPVKRANVVLIGFNLAPTGRSGGGVAGGVAGGVVMGMTTTITNAGGMMVGGQQMPSKVTDETGRFEFTDLAPGAYSLQVMPQGGFVRPQRPPNVRLTDGEAATVTIKLERTGAIGGRILDDGGDPLQRVRVTAVRRGGPGGGRGMNSAITDDLGRYRVFDLAPGEYLISATSPEGSYGLEQHAGSPGFAPTYYPGSAAIDGAQPVAVKSGDDIGGVDFALARVVLGRVTGTVRDASGQLLTTGGRGNTVGVGVMLSPRQEDMSISSSRGGGVRPDGTFVIPAVPPGEYYLTASVSRGSGPDAPREGAFAPVTVNGDEVHVDLRTNAGATIAGRVVTEGTPPPAPPMPAGVSGRAGGPPRLMVMARSASNGAAAAGANMRPATVDDDGSFVLSGIRGIVTLSVSAASRAALKSIVLGGKEVAGKALEFKGTENLRNVLITLTTDVGRIEGTVAGTGGSPAAEAWVVAFSDDPDHWFQGSPFVYLTRTLGDLPSWSPSPPAGAPARREPGSFVVPLLAPGRYYVAAVEASTSGSPPQDRDALEKLRDRARLVTVTAGQTATVQIRLDKP